MTIKTCEDRLKLAKTPEEKAFWEARIARKIARFPKYASLRKQEAGDGQKPKR